MATERERLQAFLGAMDAPATVRGASHPLANFLMRYSPAAGAPGYIGNPAQTPARNTREVAAIERSRTPGTEEYYDALLRRYGGDADMAQAHLAHRLYFGEDPRTDEARAEEGVRTALDVVTGMGPAARGIDALVSGVPFTQPVGRSTAPMFIGERAQTADLGALDRAKQMTQRGESPGDIWKQTRWMQGPDEKWRSEIADVGAAPKPLLWEYPYDTIEAARAPLGDVLEHPELFKAYPDLTELPVILNPSARTNTYTPPRFSRYTNDWDADYIQLRGETPRRQVATQRDWLRRQEDPSSPDYWETMAAASAREGDGSLEQVRDWMQASLEQDRRRLRELERGIALSSPQMSTLKHEIQHAIQNREGFAPGGSPSEFIVTPSQVRSARQLSDEAAQSLKLAQFLERRGVTSLPGVGSTVNMPADMEALLAEYGKKHDLEYDTVIDNLLSVLKDDRSLRPAQEMAHRAGERKKNYNRLLTDSVMDPQGVEGYSQLFGEVEARATQQRASLPMKWRLDRVPWEDYDRLPDTFRLKEPTPHPETPIRYR